MVEETRVVGIGHNRPPRDDTLKTSLPLYQRPNAEDWDIEIKLADLLSARRLSLQNTYSSSSKTRWGRKRSKGVSRRNPYTCYAVASRIGVTRETLRKWEGCRYSPRYIKLWVGWAKAVDLEFTDILKKVTEGYDYKTNWNYLGIDFDAERHFILRKWQMWDVETNQFRQLSHGTRVTKLESNFFHILFKAKGKIVEKETIFVRMFESDPMRSSGDIPEPKIIDVCQSNLNKKLKSLGLEIRTQWGVGKYLNTMSAKIVSQLSEAAD